MNSKQFALSGQLVDLRKEKTTSAYVPPYIAFMLRASPRTGFVGEPPSTKEVIEAGFVSTGPATLVMPTGNKISYMATFLRHPGDEKGGHFKPERTKT
jgi:hypothetical protein